MDTNTITLEQVISHYATHRKQLTDQEKAALLEAYKDRTAKLDERRDELLARALPSQLKLRETIASEHARAFNDFLESAQVLDGLFRKMDMDFLRHDYGNAPQWAIFDVDLKENEFIIRFEMALDCEVLNTKPQGASVTIPLHPTLEITPKHFRHLFGSQNGQTHLATALERYVCFDRLKISKDLANNPNGTVTAPGTFIRLAFTAQELSELPDEILNLVRRTRQINAKNSPLFATTIESYEGRGRMRANLEFRATFDQFIPNDVLDTVALFRRCFDEMFYVAEIPDWQPSKLAILPPDDPLLIGRRGNDYWLVQAFDLTDSEQEIADHYSF